MTLRVEIIGKPTSGNHRNAHGVDGKVYKLPKAREYERLAGLAMIVARRRAKWKIVKWCTIAYHFVNIEADADNVIKTVQDCAQRAGLIENDKYAVTGMWRKDWDDGEPRTYVEITEVDPVVHGIPARIIHRGEAATKRRAHDVSPRSPAPRAKGGSGGANSVQSMPRVRAKALPRRKP